MNASEIRSELQGLVSGQVGIADGIVPPVLFVTVNSIWGLVPAASVGLGSAVAISAWRLFRRRPTRFAFAGLFGTLLAVFLALRSGSAEDYFLPGIVSGAATSVLMLVSILVRRPFLAFTSWATRGWPIEWYWHPKVRPAYTRTSWMWVGFFAARAIWQWRLYLDANTVGLGVARVAMGWPALLVLLVATYVLGRRWLSALEGPSVEEFEAGTPPPWKGQEAGF